MIEVQGPSGSGKSKLLEFWSMVGLLPYSVEVEVEMKEYLNGNEDGGGYMNTISDLTTTTKRKITIPLHGKSNSIIYIHPSTTSSPLLSIGNQLLLHIQNRFITSLKEIGISSSIQGTAEEERVNVLEPYKHIISKILSKSLSSLHIHTLPPSSHPYSSLAATLSYIPIWIRKKRKGGKEVGMLVVDGFGEGYWMGRREKEEERRGGIGRMGMGMKGVKDDNESTMIPTNEDNIDSQHPLTHPLPLEGIRTSSNVSMHDIMRSITHLRKEFGMVVVVSVPGLWKIRVRDGKGDGKGAGKGDGNGGQDGVWENHLGWPYPSIGGKSVVSESSSSLKRREDSPPPPPMENSPLPSPYWPLSTHLTLSSPSGHPSIPNSNDIPQFRADITLREAMGEEGRRREEERSRVGGKGLARVSGRQVGEFGFVIGNEGLRP